jgi:uncharacterized membrane protein YbaN (DUF454 family)
MRPVYRVLRQVLGWALVVVGVIGIVVPVMPGWSFLAIGALLLAPYLRMFRRISAWLHRRYPEHRGRLRRFRDFKRPVRTSAPAAPTPDKEPRP